MDNQNIRQQLQDAYENVLPCVSIKIKKFLKKT